MAQNQPTPGTNGGVAFGVTSLVTGIAGFLTGLLKKPDSRNLSIAGLIIGIIGAATGIIVAAVWVFALIAGGVAASSSTY